MFTTGWIPGTNGLVLADFVRAGYRAWGQGAISRVSEENQPMRTWRRESATSWRGFGFVASWQDERLQPTGVAITLATLVLYS